VARLKTLKKRPVSGSYRRTIFLSAGTSPPFFGARASLPDLSALPKTDDTSLGSYVPPSMARAQSFADGLPHSSCPLSLRRGASTLRIFLVTGSRSATGTW
jgi:hypothetical protein